MAPPVLLVADDLSTIAAVKRVLGKEGYETILATSAADAVIAWGHHLPGLVVVQPSVESGRGAVLLEEIRQHPDAQLLRVVLLGESIPGFAFFVEPLPIDPEHFSQTIQREIRGPADASEWTLTEPSTDTSPVPLPQPLDEAEPWRATRPSEGLPDELPPQTQELIETPGPTAPPIAADGTWELPPEPELPPGVQASPSAMVRLFGDLPSIEDEIHRDVEAEAMASVESSLPPMGTTDEDLQRLEDEVRAEAARRRALREGHPVNLTPEPDRAFTPPSVTMMAPEVEPPPVTPADDRETSFADVSTTPPDGSPDPTREAEAAAALHAQLDAAKAKESLSRAEAIALEARAISNAQRQADDAERRRAEAELDALKRRAEHTEAMVRRERELRAVAEEEFDKLKESAGSHELRVGELEQSLTEKSALLSGAHRRLEEVEHALEVASTAAAEREAERESLLASLTHEQEAARAAEVTTTAQARHLSEAKAQLVGASQRLEELASQLETEREKSTRLEAARGDLHEKLERAVAQAVESTGEATAAKQLMTELEGALKLSRSELESVRTDLDETRKKLEVIGVEHEHASEELKQLRAERARLTTSEQTLVQTIARLETELTTERAQKSALSVDLTSMKEGLEQQRARADEAEALAQLTTERLKALEHRQVMNLALPGRRALGVPRHGTVALEQLANVVSTIALAQADVRLELGVRGGTRTIWFKKGAINGAESSFDYESLIDRARRDGLIDARQEGELRLLRTATASEQLDALKARGFVREIETVPLLQRATEAIALEAFSEEQTQYRLSDEPPATSVLLVAVPRATLPLLAEALRRAVPADALLETLGGGEAICVATDADLDVRTLGFADKERKMLSWVDGEASVEDLALASGLKQEQSLRTLVVAKLLGLIEVRAPEKPSAAISGDLDIRRLDAKYDEVQDADYFTILGLTRSASSDEVQRAFRRLAEEFDPIKYTGHPDASLQQRAQVVSSLIEEAAKALEDERRRAEYARHLLD